MKKLLTLLCSLWVSLTVTAQLTKFDGNFTEINGSGVTGAYAGYFDYFNKSLLLSGFSNSGGISVSTTNNKDANTSISTTPVTSGILYGSDDFKFFNLQKLISSVNVFKTKIEAKEYYITVVNNSSTFKFFMSGIDFAKPYTLLLNNGSIPVAYGTFSVPVPPVPEPEQISLIGGISLAGFVLIRRIKGY